MERRLFSLLSQFDIGLYMLNLSPAGMGFGVDRQQFPSVERLLDGLLIPPGDAPYILQLGPPSQKVQAQQVLFGGTAKPVKVEITQRVVQ